MYAPREEALLPAEGLAIGTLVHGGVALVRTNQNTVQSAVVCVATVVGALMNGAFNALVSFAIHIGSSFFIDGHSMAVFFWLIPVVCN